MSKKVIGALLALALVLSVFSFSVFAAGTGYETDASYTQTWGLSEIKGSAGTYTVDVILTTNYPVGPVQFKIDNVDEVTGVTVGSGYYKATVSAGKSGLVVLTPDTSSNLLGKKLSNAVIATVTYKSASNATPAIKNDVKSASNPQGTLMAARLDGDYVNNASFIVGQTATIIPVGGEMPKPTDADLAVKSGVTGVQINTGYTFGGQYAGVVYGFAETDNTTLGKADYLNAALEATDGSALTVTPNGSRYGTGTTVKVGEKVYVVVIFGDANGDGRLNGTDLTEINKCSKKVATLTGVLQMACQTNKTTNAAQNLNINASDYTAMQKHLKKVASLDQAALADAMTKSAAAYN